MGLFNRTKAGPQIEKHLLRHFSVEPKPFDEEGRKLTFLGTSFNLKNILPPRERDFCDAHAEFTRSAARSRPFEGGVNKRRLG